jgi:hypothetical protein
MKLSALPLVCAAVRPGESLADAQLKARLAEQSTPAEWSRPCFRSTHGGSQERLGAKLVSSGYTCVTARRL